MAGVETVFDGVATDGRFAFDCLWPGGFLGVAAVGCFLFFAGGHRTAPLLNRSQ